MPNIRNAILYSSLAQYSLNILKLVSVVIFARLLTPEELGVFAIASSAVLIATELRMLGAGTFLVREKEISLQKVQSAMGLSLLISWSIGLAILWAAPSIAIFYDIPSLSNLFYILSISFFLAPFISITTAILTRNLEFKTILKVQITSCIIGLITSLLLVLLGFSFWGLAWGLSVAVCTEFLMMAKLKSEIVSWRPSFRNLKPIFKFGSYVSMTSMLQRMETTVPDLIIGKMGSMSQVAFYSRGLGFLSFLSELLIMGIKPVSLPYLSGVKREGGNLAEAYIKASLLLGAICWPVLAVANIASFPIVMLMFGEQWLASVPLVSILTFWALFKAIHTLAPQLLISSHNEGLMLVKQIIVLSLTIIGIITAFPYGLSAIAFAMLLSGFADFVLSSWAIKRAIQLNPLHFIYKMRSNILLTSICWFAAYLLDWIVDFDNTSAWLSMLCLASVIPLVWLASIYLLNHPIKNEISRLILSTRAKIEKR